MKGDCACIVRPENISLRPEGGFIYFSLFSKTNTLHRSQRRIKYLLTVVLFKVTRTKVYKKKYGKVCTRPFLYYFDSWHNTLFIPWYGHKGSLRHRGNWTLVKSVCEAATKSLFWTPSCVPGFEYAPWLACSKTLCRFANQDKRKF